MKKRVGHWSRSFGQYNYQVNLWLIIALTAAGGILGGKISMRVNPHRLKKWFAFSTMAAALFMVGNAVLTQ